MAKKTFWDYLTQENKLQIECCKYLESNYPNALFTHPSNEGKRTPFERFLVSNLRMKKGVPDLLIFERRQDFAGLMIEIKVKYENGSKNYASEDQKKWLKDLSLRGYKACIIYSLEEFIEVVEYYFQN